MRKIIVILIALMTTACLNAQTAKDNASKSKSVEFLGANGSLIKKEFYDLPKVKKVGCQVLIMTNVLTGKKMGCLRLETAGYDDTYIGTLDYEELDACIKSLNYIKDQLLPSTPEVYTEVEYKTLDNLKIGAYYEKKWTAFVYTRGYTSRSAEFLDANTVASFIDVMKQAKTIIAEKTK